MNVNPFSYLIEKLKGKVNKSGDTMTGQLVINANTQVPISVSNANANGPCYMGFRNQNGTLGYYLVGTDYKPHFENRNGVDTQIALMSDIETLISGSGTFDVAVTSGSYVKYLQKGKIVTVFAAFGVNEAVTGSSNIFHGIPIPETISGTDIFILFMDDSDGTMVRSRLINGGSSGYIQNYYGRRLENGHGYLTQFCYIAK